MSRTVFSALSGTRLLDCLIVAPRQGYDEPEILSYAIRPFCPTDADGLQYDRYTFRLKMKIYGREFIAARQDRKENMRKAAFATIAFGVLLSGPAAAQDTVKIGLVLPYSGQFADTAAQMDNAIKLFMQKNGDTVAGKKSRFCAVIPAGSRPMLPSASLKSWSFGRTSTCWPDGFSVPMP